MNLYSDSHPNEGYHLAGQRDSLLPQPESNMDHSSAHRTPSISDVSSTGYAGPQPAALSSQRAGTEVKHPSQHTSHIPPHESERTNYENTEKPSTYHLNKEWRSWKLSWWYNIAVIAVELCFIAVIIALDQVSAHKDGIITVPGTESTSDFLSSVIVSKLHQYYGLLWTSLPSLIFTLYSLAWAALVAASYERQPFIELKRGGNARRTIMLDYRSYPGIYTWAVAFVYRHAHIACATLLSLIVSIAVVPLSAHLLVAAASNHQTNTSISYTTQYNDSFSIAQTNLQPFIDVATAVHAYGSTPPAWMTTEYAFAPFSLTSDAKSSQQRSYSNLTATTDAYAAYLDCQAIDTSAYTASYSSAGTEDGDETGTVSVKYTDRSCAVQLTMAVSNNTPTYGRSQFSTCRGQSTQRIGMLAGIYSSSSSSKLSSLSVISCIPSYWHSKGVLTVSANPTSSLSANFIAYTEHNSSIINPQFTVVFESALHEYTIFNPAAQTNTDAFGFSVLSAATTSAGKNMTAAMAPNSILAATERVFTTLYAALASSNVLVPSTSTTPGTGMLVEPINRLYIARPIAYTILAILILVLLSHISLWVYAVRHASILQEEPVGLLGNAILLERSDVSAVVRQAQQATKRGESVRDVLKKRFTVEGSRCSWDQGEGRITVQGLTPK